MKICLDARMYGAKATTGIGVYIKNLIDNLLEIDQKNNYTLLMSEEGFNEFQNSKVKKIKVKSHWYSWNEQIEIPRILLKNKFDLVHFPHFNVPILYSGKFITTIHDIIPKFFPGPNVRKSFIRKLGYNKVFNSAIKKSAKIITVSDYTKQNIIKNFKVDQNKIDVTHLGYDNKFKIIDDQEKLDKIRQKYNITKDFVLYVGVLRDHKNIPSLIKAFNNIKEDHDLQLVLASSIDARFPEISQSINNSPHKKDILVTDFIPEEELPLLYNAAKLFVLPSFIEGFGLVAVESLACGTPVVGSNTTSLPEILEDAAIYFNPNNISEMAKVITQVLDDQNLYQNLQSRGVQQVQKYSWRDCAAETLKIYETV